MRILKGSIDVSKIDMSKVFVGKKGKYMNVSILIRDELDQYGKIGMITQDTTKEEREAGIKNIILGNINDLPGKESNASQDYSASIDKHKGHIEYAYNDKLSNKIPPPVVNLADDLPF